MNRGRRLSEGRSFPKHQGRAEGGVANLSAARGPGAIRCRCGLLETDDNVADRSAAIDDSEANEQVSSSFTVVVARMNPRSIESRPFDQADAGLTIARPLIRTLTEFSRAR